MHVSNHVTSLQSYSFFRPGFCLFQKEMSETVTKEPPVVFEKMKLVSHVG